MYIHSFKNTLLPNIANHHPMVEDLKSCKEWPNHDAETWTEQLLWENGAERLGQHRAWYRPSTDEKRSVQEMQTEPGGVL